MATIYRTRFSGRTYDTLTEACVAVCDEFPYVLDDDLPDLWDREIEEIDELEG